ncbi:MAG: hypothetical protein N2322_06240, partial [Terrimicrobiaceae bacterium]|nr:hypothetical protein [Terrimicrobiaceae bacterium]
TWAFHLTFTCWMIPKGQPDLRYGGTLFSLIVIYLMNLLLLSGLLVLASPQVSLRGFASEALDNAMNMTVALTMAFNELVR